MRTRHFDRWSPNFFGHRYALNSSITTVLPLTQATILTAGFLFSDILPFFRWALRVSAIASIPAAGVPGTRTEEYQTSVTFKTDWAGIAPAISELTCSPKNLLGRPGIEPVTLTHPFVVSFACHCPRRQSYHIGCCIGRPAVSLGVSQFIATPPPSETPTEEPRSDRQTARR